MHTQVPQQQLHCFPAGQLSADGLHSLTIGMGVGVVTACVADEEHARISAARKTRMVRSVSITKADSTAPCLPIASACICCCAAGKLISP